MGDKNIWRDYHNINLISIKNIKRFYGLLYLSMNPIQKL